MVPTTTKGTSKTKIGKVDTIILDDTIEETPTPRVRGLKSPCTRSKVKKKKIANVSATSMNDSRVNILSVGYILYNIYLVDG